MLLQWLIFGGVAIVYLIALHITARRVVVGPVGWPRTLIVGIVLIAVSVPLATYVAREAGAINSSGQAVVSGWVVAMFVVLAFAWVFSVGVAVLIASEALWPVPTIGNPIIAFRDALARRARTRRYVQVLAIASRRGLGGLVHGRFQRRRLSNDPDVLPEELVGALNEAGVTFVKLGQLLATRRDLLPPAYIRALETLQTDATPVSWSEIEPVIVSELGVPIRERFSSVDPVPLAAASVAQVHQGVLKDGTRVVVKVQRPNARKQVEADVDILVRVAQSVEARTTSGREFGVVALAKGFAKSLEEELDYRIEFSNTTILRNAVAKSETVVLVVPRVFAEASSKRMLTMELVEGVPLNKAQAQLAQLPDDERDQLASALLDSVLEQVLVNGIFHADLHPGNLLLRPDNTLGMIDFGAVGILEKSMRELLATLLLAVADEDDIAATDALLLLVEKPDNLDVSGLQRDVGRVLTIMKNTTGDASVFSQLLDVIRSYHLAIPFSLGQAFRTIVAVDGCLHILDPDFDLVARALVRVPHFLRRMLNPRDLVGSARTQAALLAAMIRRAPRRIEAISSALELGTLGVRVRSLASPQDRSWVGEIVTEAVTVFVAITAVFVAIVLLTSNSGPLIAPHVYVLSFIGACIGLVGFVLIVRLFRRLIILRGR